MDYFEWFVTSIKTSLLVDSLRDEITGHRFSKTLLEFVKSLQGFVG